MSPAEVSIIVPMYNADRWLDACMASICCQTFPGAMQLSIYDDASTDKSAQILQSWKPKLEKRGIHVVSTRNASTHPAGVGFAKNRAVEQSSGKFLCFLDADDVMHPDRIEKQYALAVGNEDAIIGCKFHRLPEGSTVRYTNWANGLNSSQLYTQIYTSNGPTLIMPTWFLHRSVFDTVGGFSEAGKGTPEDLLFFYDHLNRGGRLLRVDEDLLMYRYHAKAESFSVTEETIWKIRLREFEKNVLDHLAEFTIWNAGKAGRKLYRCLSAKNQAKVATFCDVDRKKIARGVYVYEECEKKPKPSIRIVHFKDAKPPLVICMKQDLTGGDFEHYLASLCLREGVDFYHFG